jgi:HSP20 family protein
LHIFFLHADLARRLKYGRAGSEINDSGCVRDQNPTRRKGPWQLGSLREGNITREIDNLFRGIGLGQVLEQSFATAIGGSSYPRINLRQDANNVYVEALLPGVDARALEMTVLKNTLTLAGERKNGIENVSWHRRERGLGRFLRPSTCPSTSTSRVRKPTTVTAC